MVCQGNSLIGFLTKKAPNSDFDQEHLEQSSAKRQIRFRVSAGFYWFPGFRKPGNLETRKLASHVEMTSGMLTTTRKLMQLLTSNKLMGMMINKMVYKEGIEALQSVVMRKTIRHPSGTINR